MRHYTVPTLVLTLLFTPVLAHAEGPAPKPIQNPTEDAVKLKNVELTEAGSLAGQYLTHSGQPLASAPIVVTFGKTTHKAVTDEKGRFIVEGLQGGRCVLQIGGDTFACQLWMHGTAPPNSIESVAIVKSDGSVVRGNGIPLPYIPIPGRLSALSTKQLICLGLIAGGATAIAVAANQNDHDAS